MANKRNSRWVKGNIRYDKKTEEDFALKRERANWRNGARIVAR